MSEWQPIETAPQDGSDNPIQVLFSGTYVSTAYYDAYYDVGGFGYEAGEFPWIEPISAEQISKHYGAPTHWMPLPKPPGEA